MFQLSLPTYMHSKLKEFTINTIVVEVFNFHRRILSNLFNDKVARKWLR